MSHIPASAMPHARADGDTIDDQPRQPEQAKPASDPAIATPPAFDGPVIDTGNREEATAGQATHKEGQSRTPAQPPLDAAAAQRRQPSPAAAPERRSALGTPFGIAALAIGGIAVIGGLAATLLPAWRAESEGKGKAKPKKRRKKG